jgi:hypothetical protein
VRVLARDGCQRSRRFDLRPEAEQIGREDRDNARREAMHLAAGDGEEPRGGRRRARVGNAELGERASRRSVGIECVASLIERMPCVAVGPGPTTESLCSLEYLHAKPLASTPRSCGEAGEPTAHDNDVIHTPITNERRERLQRFVSPARDSR